MPVSPTAELESIKGMMDEASLITVAHPPFTVFTFPWVYFQVTIGFSDQSFTSTILRFARFVLLPIQPST
jgi:hypothetical protein